MRICLLGGCADMAVPLLKQMAIDKTIEQVVLADLNVEKARVLAAQYGPQFSAAHCDAESPETVTAAIRGCDAAISYIGPFYRFEKKLAACAIEAKVPYVSIADDYDAYLDVCTLEDAARAAGVKILTGFGNSPGLTQILARKGYNAVPGPFSIRVNWCAGSAESVGTSNLMHLFHIFNGTTLQWMDGHEVRVKTGAGKKWVEFPPPINGNWVYYTGHAESVSLPRNLAGLQEVTLHGGVKPNYIATLVKAMGALGLFATHARRAWLARTFHRIEGWFSSPGIDKSVGRVEIFGKRDGQTVCKHFLYVGHIAEITSLPAYVAAKWLAQGRFNDMPGGVYAPERALPEPDAFLAELMALGVSVTESDIYPAKG